MCQITYIDFQNPVVGKFVKYLVAQNSVDNPNGWGYKLKGGKILKTKESAVDFLVDNPDELKTDGLCGIFHVRLASKHNPKVEDVNSHPFTHKSVTVVHNGAFYPVYSHDVTKTVNEIVKTLGREPIDSERFTIALGEVVGRKNLKAEHILDALDAFTGQYCMLIEDKKQADELFVVKGLGRDLHKVTFFQGDVKVGFVINTSSYNLHPWCMMICDMFGYTYDLEALADRVIFQYTFGTYGLKKLIDIPVANTTTKTTPIYDDRWGRVDENYNRSYPLRKPDNEIGGRIYDKLFEMRMDIPHLYMLSSTILGKVLYALNSTELEQLEVLLDTLGKEAHKGRKKIWEEILEYSSTNSIPTVKIYSLAAIDFPYMLNSRTMLKSGFNRLQKEVAKK